MAITHPASVRNAIADVVVDRIDQGTGASQGTLRIKQSTTVLAQLSMANPAFASASSGTATANTIADDSSADASGTADAFDIIDRDSAVVVSGTVTATGGGGDIELDNAAITAGDTVSITSLTYSAPN